MMSRNLTLMLTMTILLTGGGVSAQTVFEHFETSTT